LRDTVEDAVLAWAEKITRVCGVENAAERVAYVLTSARAPHST
jgi:hypothetical protein